MNKIHKKCQSVISNRKSRIFVSFKDDSNKSIAHCTNALLFAIAFSIFSEAERSFFFAAEKTFCFGNSKDMLDMFCFSAHAIFLSFYFCFDSCD